MTNTDASDLLLNTTQLSQNIHKYTANTSLQNSPALPDAERYFKVLAAPYVHCHVVSAQILEELLVHREQPTCVW